MSWDVSFRGYDFSEANGITVKGLEITPATKVGDDEVFGGGAAFTEQLVDGQTIKIGGTVKGSDAAGLLTNVSAMLERIQDANEGLLSLASNREIRCAPRPGRIVPTAHASGRWARWSCDFIARDAYWRGTTEQTDTQNISSSSSVSYSLTNSGDAPARIIWEIKNKSATAIENVTLTLKNTTTGKQLRLGTFSLAQNEILKADPEFEQFLITTGASTTGLTPKTVIGGLLELQAGSNSMELVHNFGATPNVDVTAKFRYGYRWFGEAAV